MEDILRTEFNEFCDVMRELYKEYCVELSKESYADNKIKYQAKIDLLDHLMSKASAIKYLNRR